MVRRQDVLVVGVAELSRDAMDRDDSAFIYKLLRIMSTSDRIPPSQLHLFPACRVWCGTRLKGGIPHMACDSSRIIRSFTPHHSI